MKHIAKLKAVVLGLLVLGVFASVATASASAAEQHFYVGGTKLGTTKVPLAGTGKRSSSRPRSRA